MSLTNTFSSYQLAIHESKVKKTTEFQNLKLWCELAKLAPDNGPSFILNMEKDVYPTFNPDRYMVPDKISADQFEPYWRMLIEEDLWEMTSWKKPAPTHLRIYFLLEENKKHNENKVEHVYSFRALDFDLRCFRIPDEMKKSSRYGVLQFSEAEKKTFSLLLREKMKYEPVKCQKCSCENPSGLNFLPHDHRISYLFHRTI